MKKICKKVLLVILTGLMCLSMMGVSSAVQDESLADIIRKYGKTEINLGEWSEAADSHGADHVQGICVDDEGKYMYASFTNMVVKIDVRTGEIVGTVGGLATGTHVDGAHIGDITYYNGKLYAPLEYKASGRWYIAVFDAEKITEMNMHYTEPGMMYAAYVPQVGDAFSEELYAGEHNNNPSSMGHRYGTGGIDGITFGKIPGGGYDTDGDGVTDISVHDKEFMFVAMGIYGNVKRYDNENQIFLVFSPEKITEENLLPFSEEMLNKDYTESEKLFYEHKIFCYTGNYNYGAQQLEFDRDTGDLRAECYERNKGTEFPEYTTRMIFDGSKPLYMDTVEVGQSVTGDSAGFVSQADAHKVAALYTDYEDADGDGDYEEQETGWHITLKCQCGNGKNIEDHKAVSHGKTGKSVKICGNISSAYFDTGLVSLGDNLFYGVLHSNQVIDGVTYFSGTARLYELDRETGCFTPYGHDPYYFNDYEGEPFYAEGFGGSKNAMRVSATGEFYDLGDAYRCPVERSYIGKSLQFSAWVKVNNTELKNNRITFILWSHILADRTSENSNLPERKSVSLYRTINVENAGLKRGEWVKVTATVSNWDAKFCGTIPAGYGGMEEDTFVWTDDKAYFDGVALRLYGPANAASSVSEVEYDVDDMQFRIITPYADIEKFEPKQLLKGSGLDSEAEVNSWNGDGRTFVAGGTPDGSAGYMRIGNGKDAIFTAPGQALGLKPNHLYKFSFWAKIEQMPENVTANGLWFMQWAGGRIPDTNGYNENNPGFHLVNVFSTEWKKIEVYYMQDRKTFVQQDISSSFRFYTGSRHTAHTGIFGVDDIQIWDLGPVTNGDFSMNGEKVYRNNGTYTYTVMGWATDGATATLDSGAMKVTAAKDGGRAYQGINMENGGLYKLSFKAKTTGEAKPLAVVLDRKVPSPGGDKEAYNVPDYQYITGTNDVSATYADGAWQVTDNWQTYECYVSNEFPLMEGKTAEKGIIPRTPYLYFMADGNKTGTELYIDDVVLEQVSTVPCLKDVSVSGVNKPGEKLTVNANMSDSKGTTGGCVAVRALLKDGENYASIGNLYAGDSFVVSENVIGKELVFCFTPIDGDGAIGESMYVTPDAATDKWCTLYYDEKAKTARFYSSEAVTADIVFASYQSGNLIDVKVVPVTAAANAKVTADGSALATANADTIKVMAWNSLRAAIPLCENIEIK